MVCLTMLRIICIVGGCATITILLGVINIWLGILSMPIMYEIADSFLSEQG